MLCSISPGPVTLAGLMDPDTYEVTDEVDKLDRSTELARYDLFPMYPTCEYQLNSHPTHILPSYHSQPCTLDFYSFPPRRERRLGNRGRHIRHPIPFPHFEYERKRERWLGTVRRLQQFLSH
jgi:hypothetical protein